MVMVLCQQTEFSFLGKGKSTAAPWTASSQCTCNCCEVANSWVIGPYFFKDTDGRAVTVISVHYVEMLWKFLTQELSCAIELWTIWFQQDGATAHKVRTSIEVIWEMFTEHIISLRGKVPWPACSPDLSVCVYLLWGYLEAKVYTTRPRPFDDLKVPIRKHISAIPENMVRWALRNLQARLEEYVRNDGSILVMFSSKLNEQRCNEIYV
jgi:hypothetical protein